MGIKKAPALALGLHALLGAGWALFPHPIYLLGHLLLFLLLLPRAQKLCLASCTVACAAFFSTHFQKPAVVEGEKTAELTITKIAPSQSPFHHSYAYYATFDKIPVTFFLPEKEKRLKANTSYLAKGTLEKDRPFHARLKLDRKTPLQPLNPLHTLTEMRFLTKKKVKAFLHAKIDNPKVSHFLGALVTGDLEERLLSLEFRKLGVSHILAISGFHFALIAFFCGMLLHLIFPYRVATFILLATLTGFALFLGHSPSITRAYLASSFFLVGALFNLRASPLQFLGIALLIEVFTTPLDLFSPAFQLSFLCTLGLLLFFKPMQRWLNFLSPKRTWNTLSQMNLKQQHALFFLSGIKKGVAASLSVHLLAAPVTFSLFHEFPLMSFVYNLFIPAALGLSLLLLLLSLFFPFLHAVNNFYTAAILHLISHPPASLNFSLYIPTLPFWLLFTLMALPLGIGLKLLDQKGESPLKMSD